MLTRYQYGCLQKMKRKDGIERWQFRWQQRSPDGRLRERKITFGSVKDFPERSKALEEKLAELRFDINTEKPTKLNSITMAATIQHYIERELADDRLRGAPSTRRCKKLVLNRWVLPRWGSHLLKDIKTVAVENWLDSLTTERFKKKLGQAKPLAGGTKEKIRDAMSHVFNHAIRWEFTDRNPIIGIVKGAGVRVSAKRETEPDILDVAELHALLGAVGVRERAMLSLAMHSGLRRGELAGLKWGDFDFSNLAVAVTRSVVNQQVGDCKTEISRKLMPLDRYVAEDVLAWYRQAPYRAADDWVWASDARRAGDKRGRQPLRLSAVMRRPHSAAGRATGDPEADRVAYLPSNLRHAIESEWRRREGRPGAAAALDRSDVNGRVRAGPGSRQATGAEQVGDDDSAEGACTATCTAGFRSD